MTTMRSERETADARRGELLADALERIGSGPAGQGLDPGERLQVLDVLIAALEGTYAHLVAKRAAYASDPVQALTLLRRRAAELTEGEFHRAVTGIVTGLRDAHTRYSGRTPLGATVAVLPFLVEQHGPDADPHYLVSKVDEEYVPDRGFRPGVELVSWNGVPFPRAVEIHADRETGGRPDSRRARALESLTFRALEYGPPPDELWVLLGYRTVRGRLGEVRLPWRVVAPDKARTAMEDEGRGLSKQSIDLAAEAVRRAKKLVFAPDLWQRDRARRPETAPLRTADGWLDTPLQDVLAARQLNDQVGYLRIWSFDVADDEAFVREMARLLGLLPPTGVIVDLRANPGGLIWAAERALQLFTDATIAPTRFSLLATPATRQMADNPFNRLELEAWSPSLQEATSTGELYAQPLPLTDPSWCNDIGRTYPGRAVAVVDANTYSSGDLFAAGWVDHRIGPLVTVGQATGAGGANVWTSYQLRDALAGTDGALPPLPRGTGFTMSFRRAIRSAAGDGIPIEDLGISGIPYHMTRSDLLDANVDLHAFCTRLLGQDEHYDRNPHG